MNEELLIVKLLDLVEGRETPESWRGWWNDHEAELESMLSRGEYLKLKPCQHGFQWVTVLTSQKGAIYILNNCGIEYKSSNFYQEQYLKELDVFCKKQRIIQKRKQKEFEENYKDLFIHYPKFSKALAKVLLPSDKIKLPAKESQIYDFEQKLGFTFSKKIKEFFLLTEGINISTGVIIDLSGIYILSINEKEYCVLGEFWKEADGDLLLMQSASEIIYYYSHEKNKVKKLCNNFYELLENKISHYINKN